MFYYVDDIRKYISDAGELPELISGLFPVDPTRYSTHPSEKYLQYSPKKVLKKNSTPPAERYLQNSTKSTESAVYVWYSSRKYRACSVCLVQHKVLQYSLSSGGVSLDTAWADTAPWWLTSRCAGAVISCS